MNKQVAKELDKFVKDIEFRYSRKDREGNFNNESFYVKEIIPTSDLTACVIFKKNTGKEACLLYTSPSPRDRTRSRMPSSA